MPAPSRPSERARQRGVDLRHQPASADPEAEDDAPLLPHERDQSVDMTDGERDPVIQQAHDDVERGLQDTDRGPPSDRAYGKLKR